MLIQHALLSHFDLPLLEDHPIIKTVLAGHQQLSLWVGTTVHIVYNLQPPLILSKLKFENDHFHLTTHPCPYPFTPPKKLNVENIFKYMEQK